jgi:hypothetical protein
VPEEIIGDRDFGQTQSVKALGLERVYYLVSVSLEKFLLNEFVEVSGVRQGNHETGVLTFAPKDSENGDYGVRLEWFVGDPDMHLRIEYVSGTRQHAPGERAPYAEAFMEWLGQFFKYESAQAHSHARLAFPSKSRRSLFPLPLKTALAGEPEIDGISLNLPSRPAGISKVRISLGRTSWHLEVVSDKRITFKTFDVHSDISAYSPVLNTLFEERAS